MNKTKKHPIDNSILWGVFFLYIIISGYTIINHELWGDEIHSWNIVKGSNSYFDLISNIRYEGHPPVWYTILWPISRLTHNVEFIQLAQFTIASLVALLILFFSSFSFLTRILIPFGYYFLYEYGVISRNYATGVLLTFCLCYILHKNFKYKFILYYILLFLLSNTHLLGLLMACSLHLYFLLLIIEQKKKTSTLVLNTLIGGLIILPSLYFIIPPSDSALNVHFWMSRWNIKQLAAVILPLIRAFIPIPAWWNYNFWNTEFLLEAHNQYFIIKVIIMLIVTIILVMLFHILKGNKKSFLFFTANLFVSLFLSIFIPLSTQRYSGFIFIGFIAAYWLYCSETATERNNKRLVNILLVIQLIGATFAVIKDIQFPFSNAPRVTELVNEIPNNTKIVTDYWALNTLTAFTDKPFYCIEMHRNMSYLLWNKELGIMIKQPNLYYNGIKYLFKKEGIGQVYMISLHSPVDISRIDSLLLKLYNVKLIDKREGAIEKGGNLYLYKISIL